MVLIKNGIPCRDCFANGAPPKRRASLHVSCELRQPRTRSAPVVMRELPLPGQTARLQSLQKERAAPKQQVQQNGNGNGASRQKQDQSTYDRDTARRVSNSQASTSSYPLPRSAAKTRPSINGDRPNLNTLEASTAMNEAAPGFRAASHQASSTADHIAEGMLQAVQDVPELQVDDSFRWSRDNYNSKQRSLDIWSFIIKLRGRLWYLDQKWSYPGGWTESKKSARLQATAVWTRQSLLALGPTFIKVGQLFSTRSDLFPAAFTEELAKLQDRVPAFAPAKAIAIIEAEFGAPVCQLFRSFQEQPIAAASLGQVHRAVLHSGEQVVVKVQRPGLKNLFDIDLANLKVLAKQLDRSDENSDYLGIYQEYDNILYKEIDYIAEGRNADRFRRNFQPDPAVRVPHVHWQLTSTRAITLDYMPGIKITDLASLTASGIDTAGVARRATEAYLVQILKHGFLHSDPHPGNIAVDPQGNLIFYDFGMMSSIVPATKERLLDVFYGIYRKDAAQVVKALTDLGIIVAQGDNLSLRRAISYFLNNIAKQTKEQETIAAIGEDIFAVALDQPFRFPATFTFVLRAFSTLEGIGRALDKDYKFVAVAQPYAQQLLNLQDTQAQQGFILEQVGKQALSTGQATIAMPSRVEQMSSTLSSLEAGDIKLRVRALEVERAARRAQIMQTITIQTVGCATLTNVGSQLAISGHSGWASAFLIPSLGVGYFIWRGFKRVKRIDKFEKNIRG